MGTKPTYDPIPLEFVESVCAQLAGDRRVRRKLPGGGVLNVDRLLPFLCVYRRRALRQDPGTQSFVRNEAAYLTAPGDAPVRQGLARLVREIAETASRRFGAFLIVEVWTSPDEELAGSVHPETGEAIAPAPGFRIHQRGPRRPRDAVNALRFALERIHLQRQPANVAVEMQSRVHAPAAQPLISADDARRLNCYAIGLEIRPVFRDPQRGLYPELLRQLNRQVSRALKRAFFAFAIARTNERPEHFFSLGRRSLPRLVFEVDHQLAEIGSGLDFLLQVTPVNAETSFRDFEASGFRRDPVFIHRPLAMDPLLLKRELSSVPTERVADATLAHLFRQTQDELDRMITMLGDIGTPRFLQGSLQVFGGVEPQLLRLAQHILERLPRGSGDASAEADPSATLVTAGELARRASKEIRAYRKRHPAFTARAEVREDVYSGMLAVKGNLLIGRETTVSARRVEALLAHEVGTHLVTYFNGLAQPLRLLSTGLAGYEALQEGLAVLAEYFVGGLTRGRMRMLAARVLAAGQMIAGEPFSGTWRMLTDEHGFEARVAWTITMRVYRGGGLTKDVVYLRGLEQLLGYVGRGGDLTLLFAGKLALEQVPIVRELLLRGVLVRPPLEPAYLAGEHAAERLRALGPGSTALDLVGSA